jgi:DNA-directed RNA polymerase specialized sigma24 family protein
MPYLDVYDQLNSDCPVMKTTAVGILYERYFEILRRHAFRCLKTRKYPHDAIEQATELAMDVFERILRWVSKEGWPGNRDSAPWTSDNEFEAYWFTAVDRRAIDACKRASRSLAADPQTSLIFEQTSVFEAEKDEVDYSEVIQKIHEAAKESLKDRHFRVIPAFAKEYMEFKDTKTLTEIYAVVAEKKQLGSGPYVANCWSAGVCLVKRVVRDMNSKAASDLLAKAALTNGFPAPRRT